MKMLKALTGMCILVFVAGCTAPYMSPKTLSSKQLSDLRKDESIVWGQVDDSFVFNLTQSPNSPLDSEVRTLAEQTKLPVWTCVHHGSVMMGKFDPDVASKQVRLTFVNKETGKRITTSQTAGISGTSPFYVTLPEGTYTLDLHFTWPGLNYRVSAERTIKITAGCNAVYIGHLHMAVKRIESVNMLFDTGDFTDASKWFRSKHPSFQGSMLEQRIAKQIIVTDKDGHLFWLHRWRIE